MISFAKKFKIIIVKGLSLKIEGENECNNLLKLAKII